MRILAFIVPCVLITSVAAQPLSPRIANLIPADSSVVYSVNLERHTASALQAFYPVLPEPVGRCPGPPARLIVARQIDRSYRTLMIVTGENLTAACLQTDAANAGDAEAGSTWTALAPGIAIAGDPDTVRGAIQRWADKPDAGESEIAAIARRQADIYDNWGIAMRPLQVELSGAYVGPYRRYRAEFVDAVEEVRAGVRLGNTIEVNVDVMMKTPEDALAAAALGRWLRGAVQARSELPEAALAEVAENLTVTSSGSKVTLSFFLDSARLRQLDDEMRKRSEFETTVADVEK